VTNVIARSAFSTIMHASGVRRASGFVLVAKRLPSPLLEISGLLLDDHPELETAGRGGATLSCRAKRTRTLRGRNHTEGYPGGLIETMNGAQRHPFWALQKGHFHEVSRAAGPNGHFTLNQHIVISRPML
jgi:hypothetical protein